MKPRVCWLASGILAAAFWSNNLPAMDFRRHNADSPTLNAIAATGKIEAGDTEGLLRYLGLGGQ